MTPAQILAAYGLTGITFPSSSGTVKGDGTGQTIALIEMDHDPNLASDLHHFDQTYGLPDPKLEVINQAGAQTDANWAQEEAMDVEWAHAVAPGAAILVVEAAPGYYNDQAFQNLMTAVQTASATPGVSVVSMSWGFNEFPSETQYDGDFTRPGITYIAASGDNPGAEYPASSPDVLSVGGTTLVPGAAGAYGSESAWPYSGGGYSQYEAEPAYQQSVQATGQRSTPDVAFDGDPNTGVQVFYTPPDRTASASGSLGSWSTVGGTSLGAPAWAGLLAIIDQGRALAGRPALSGASQTLASLYALSSGNPSSGAFHAVAPSSRGLTWGQDIGIGLPWGGFGGWGWSSGPASTFGSSAGATPGATANTQTGLGTPNGPALIGGMVGSTVTAPLPSPFPSPTTSPTATPNPTPTPAPITPTGKHHHHRRAQRANPGARAHTTTAHGRRIAAQGRPAVKLLDRSHHPA